MGDPNPPNVTQKGYFAQLRGVKKNAAVVKIDTFILIPPFKLYIKIKNKEQTTRSRLARRRAEAMASLHLSRVWPPVIVGLAPFPRRR